MQTTTTSPSNARVISLWLFLVSAAIYFMVIIGGATRLTGSGLSITEWKPILGAIPPITEVEWEKTFDLYKQYPQYKLINPDMDLAGFKCIYFWEYLHRLWGRAIGLIFVLPLLYFWIKGKLSRELIPGLALIFALGVAQGLLGWFMVKSGLVDKPWVSPYRLTAHLLLALLLYSCVIWQALSLWFKEKTGMAIAAQKIPAWLWPVTLALLVLLVLQIAYGGFTAGLHAALSYPTFPKMNGQWWPNGLLSQSPLCVNFFENHAMVQLIHRLLAVVLGVGVLVYWIASCGKLTCPVFAKGRHLLLAVVLLQFLLGVWTVLNSLGHIPVVPAVLHQAGAVALLTVLLVLAHQINLARRSPN